MKRRLAFLLVLTMLLALSACSSIILQGNGDQEKLLNQMETETGDNADGITGDAAQAEDDETAQTNTEDTEEGDSGGDTMAPPAVETVSKEVTVNLEDIGEMVEDNGVPLLSFVLYRATVTVAGDQVASEKITDAIAAYNDLFAAGKEADVEMAREGYTMYSDPDYWYGYARERSCDVLCNNGSVLSLRFNDYYDYGGAHPSTIYSTKNYDVSTGNELTLANIVENIDTFMVYAIESVTEQIASREDLANGLFSDYQQYISSFVADGYWYFGETGLVFICNTTTIAPYAAGVMEFTIPYTELHGMLKENYFPVTQTGTNATPNAGHAGESGRDESGTYNTVVIDAEGEHICVWFDATVTDVCLQVVQVIGEEDFEYIPRYTLFSTSVMQPEDTLEVDAYIPDTFPNLMVSWRQGDGTTASRLISSSGKDGSALLLEP